MAEGRRVVITGLGIVSSIGQDIDTYWKSLVAGKSGVKRIAAFDPSAYPTQFAGEIPDFDPLRWLDKRSAGRMDRFCQMGMGAAIQAVKDSGLDFAREDRQRCGAVIGSGIGGLWEIEEQHKRLLERGPSRVSPFLVPRLMINACSGMVAIHYELNGPNFAAVSACASSNHSLAIAFRAIRWGDVDVMIAGGNKPQKSGG